MEKPPAPRGGQKVVHYSLEDQHGVQHLAVVGEERDTRDGHYLYTAVRMGACRT